MQKRKKQYKQPVESPFLQVGVSKVEDRILKYSDIPKSLLGWISDLRFRPIKFDLVILKIAGQEKLIPAWWDGRGWRGRLWKRDYQVVAWKRGEDYV